ncbi:MAG TPA: tetratricopeptide repeat protein [Prosthecobacter sp.]|nr:tetratricopeptide repeat protein [Prosthecobacter sp.]
MSSAVLNAQSTDELLKQADAFDHRLRAAEALPLYQQAEKLDPKNADILVRIARQYRHLMADAGSKDEKMRLGSLALDYGRRAAALAPKNSDAQLSTAISQGKMLALLGTKEQMQASKEIKASADKAIQLNPKNDLAWHIAGRWHRVLADISPLKRTLASIVYEKLPDATNEDAVACFQKAINLNPNRVIHYIELGRAYSQMGREDDARTSIKKGLAMPSVEKDDPEAKRLGREVLAKLN